MHPRPKYHIFGQAPGAAAPSHLREGSCRLGRTMRAAQAIARYTQARIFVCYARKTQRQVGEDTFTTVLIPDPQAERHPASGVAPTPAVQGAKHFPRPRPKILEQQLAEGLLP